MNDYKLLRLSQVMEKTGMRKTLIYGLMRIEQFPQPINLGRYSVAWLESEIDEWIFSQRAERNAKKRKTSRGEK
ncbi:AlpA family phage regulatory protein [Klebsiella aerogenes]|uniref:AlpA family phage regulatory protein n=1 Tax=Klebsiella aerogenes TaxID=548 RepID=UPI00063C6F88|nr:AlpA family transcriptional regulator [Klebsiella aerogenes]ELW2863484.1 AlpA family transcriptional regulator [Salmonella enterica]KLF55096.1 hypothetical protein YA35_13725 [Klebsiella aerogenes]MDX7184892.1 AlpA family transcriptional regulator [Klebsiella aerogenes]HCT8363732.1 AlpA family transcriptional regulator [Klebsiella aerogenes]